MSFPNDQIADIVTQISEQKTPFEQHNNASIIVEQNSKQQDANNNHLSDTNKLDHKHADPLFFDTCLEHMPRLDLMQNTTGIVHVDYKSSTTLSETNTMTTTQCNLINTNGV